MAQIFKHYSHKKDYFSKDTEMISEVLIGDFLTDDAESLLKYH